MKNEEKALRLMQEHLSKKIDYSQRNSVEKTLLAMAKWKDKQFIKELRKVLEFSASPVDMEDEINNLIQKYENL